MDNVKASGGFFSGLGDFFLDALDPAKDVVVKQELSEIASEQNEGPGEFANPNTVSQPVTPSQLPSGQPFLSNISQQLGVPPAVLLVAGGLLLVLLLKRSR